MSAAATKDQTIEGKILQEAPTAQSLTVMQPEAEKTGKFSDVLRDRMDDIAPMLPVATALCNDRRSLFRSFINLRISHSRKP